MGDGHDACRAAFDAGKAVHRGIALDYEDFAKRWVSMTARQATRTASDGEALPAGGTWAADLFLAIACDAGSSAAWEALQREYGPRLRGLLRRHGASDREASELLADLPGYLCEAPADERARSRMGTFDGSGSLFSWLAVLALRTVNQQRRSAVAGPAALESGSDISTRRANPANGAVGQETARRFQDAIALAWRTLTSRERLAVLLKHRDGLAGRDIARLLGIGEPRVSRLLDSGLARLRDAVRRRMPETPPGTSTPDEALWQALRDALTRHLATLSPTPHDHGEGHDA